MISNPTNTAPILEAYLLDIEELWERTCDAGAHVHIPIIKNSRPFDPNIAGGASTPETVSVTSSN